MSISDDEEEFLSADEAGFGDETDKIEKHPNSNSEEGTSATTLPRQINLKDPQPVIEPDHRNDSSPDIQPQDSDLDPDEHIAESTVHDINEQYLDKAVRQDDEIESQADLAERIRERNLKIARKFSAEIAKNVKASAPIPLEIGRIGNKIVQDIEYSSDPKADASSNPPPAPPPTPALSSSYSSSSDPSSAIPTAPSSQYSWRVPMKGTTKQSQETIIPSSSQDPDNQKTKLALDRLADNFGNKDPKKVLESVLNDIKNVSIKSTMDESLDDGLNISSLQSFGSTLGGWGWNSAANILASASQVTSQVGSVLDSVVKGSQQLAGGLSVQNSESNISHEQSTQTGNHKKNK